MLHQGGTDLDSVADLLLTAKDYNVPELIETIKSTQNQNPKEILLFYTNVLSERQDLPMELIMELSQVILNGTFIIN
jgi:hypothetical protein